MFPVVWVKFMVGINVDDIPVPHRLAERGYKFFKVTVFLI